MSDRFRRYIEGQTADPKPPEPTLEKVLEHTFNNYSIENESGTPDFILAEYMMGALRLWEETVKKRAAWRGESVELPALQQLHDGKRTVPMIVYSGNFRMRNDIGEAEIKLAPGELAPIGRIEHVIAVFEEEKEVEELLPLCPLSETAQRMTWNDSEEFMAIYNQGPPFVQDLGEGYYRPWITGIDPRY